MRPVDEQMAILMQGAEFGDPQIYQAMEAELRERLQEGRPLRVYCGYDPTATDIHLGHTVPMRKLRQFQDLGHEVIFLIGTFTGLVGDPSDKDSTRRQQTPEELMANAKTYTDQAFKMLDPQQDAHPLQRRLAEQTHLRRRDRSGQRTSPCSSSWRATTSRKRYREGRPDLAARVLLRADAGLRRRGDADRRADRRHRAAVQPAGGPQAAGEPSASGRRLPSPSPSWWAPTATCA